jgi:hypothetical protein
LPRLGQELPTGRAIGDVSLDALAIGGGEDIVNVSIDFFFDVIAVF